MRRSRIVFWLMICLLALGACSQKKAREFQQYAIDRFMNTKRIGGGSISHDDRLILYFSNESGIINGYTVPAGGGPAKQITQSKKESIFVYSFFPADNRFLYGSDRGGNEINHLYLQDEDGKAIDLTPGEKERAQFHGWAHNGKSFLFSSNKRDPKFMDVYEMDVATLKPSLVYKNEKGLDLAAISPDKRYLALVRPITTSNTEMYLYEVPTKKLTHLSPHQGEVNFSPQMFSADSKSLYYLTDESSEFAYLKRMDLDTRQSVVDEQVNWDIMYAYLSHNGRYKVVGIDNDARTEIRIEETATGKLVELPKMSDGEIRDVHISRSERLMTFHVNGARAPDNLYVYDFASGQAQKLTDAMNPEIHPEDLIEAQVVRYKSFDGLDIPAVYYEPHQALHQKVPGLVWVHGGPGGQSRVGYSPLIQYLANHGYAVIAVNNRGSSGYGKTFFKMDDLKHGEGDLDDCVEAKKFLAGTGRVDPNKIGIIGGSYGGYMVLAALAFRPEAFTVGVDIFGVANWLRTLKNTPPWWGSFRAALFAEMGDPAKDEEYLKKISPLFHADKIRRPLLVLQGANDPRVLKVESDEIVAAVKKNNVPVEYMVFDDEGHGFVKKENEIKGNGAILEFLERHLK
jgi:dipeptidyl aminopeptidase/acylaminoacyl peptidase